MIRDCYTSKRDIRPLYVKIQTQKISLSKWPDVLRDWWPDAPLYADINHQSICLNDSDIKVFHPSQLREISYDCIIISVLGREREIITSLLQNYSVIESKIKVFSLHESHINEHQEVFKILDLLPKRNVMPVMIQIGASEGNLVRRFAQNGWKAYGFDANPLYANDLISDETNLYLYNMAITLEEQEYVTFYISDNLNGIGSLKIFHDSHRPIQVPAITLKKFYLVNQIDAIDFFMIDAELMDLDILKTHDWSIPIGALMMECGVHNAQDIYNFIIQSEPNYLHVVFVWKKKNAMFGEKAICTGMYSIEEFLKLPQSYYFGNILFYRKD